MWTENRIRSLLDDIIAAYNSTNRPDKKELEIKIRLLKLILMN